MTRFLFVLKSIYVIFYGMSDLNNQTEGTGSSFAEETFIAPPPERKVVFFNDDFTTMDFVTSVLVSVFNKSHDEAEKLMMQVHENGSSIVGTYTYDIAVSRTNLTILLARKNGFPLRVEVE